MRILILILFPFLSFAQLNVKDFGAKGTGLTDDQPAIQRALDSAVKTSGRVYIPAGKYRIDRPLMIYKWDGVRYQQCYIRVEGESSMWDNGTGSVIIANFKDAFALGVQVGKGVQIKGLTFQGQFVGPKLSPQEFFSTNLKDYTDSTCRDNRWSPYSGIVIDPFGPVPSDGIEGNAYPSMRAWYRGPQTSTGSTGCRFEDLSIGGFTIDIIVSPNGYTRNGEMMTFQNIRFGDAKIGFVGCQDQEKTNRIINVGAWSRIHTLFAWGIYGSQRPGHYTIDGVNVAGGINQLLYRRSYAYFPLHIYNCFTESLGSIGTWDSLVSDGLHNSSINLQKPDNGTPLPDFTMLGTAGGVQFDNVTVRYYGLNYPLIFKGDYKGAPGTTGLGYLDNRAKYTYFPDQTLTVTGGTLTIKGRDTSMKVGQVITFFHPQNLEFKGQGLVSKIDSLSFNVSSLSTTVKNGGWFAAGRFKNQL